MSRDVTKAERITEWLTPWLSLLGVIGFLCAIVLAACPGCQPPVHAAFSLKVDYAKKTPTDASVVIDEQYVGPLGYVAAHGVRLRVGEHRVSITKAGYFPYDRLIVKNDSEPFKLEVALEPIPD
ncbi:MAG TPA: PEGA domain-containing protein [Polyangiaceae bacterium]|nr:PEGA domain-containing protein [Polyangiaceae bacterium]